MGGEGGVGESRKWRKYPKQKDETKPLLAFIWYFLAPISQFSICVFNKCEIIYNVMKEYIEQLQFDSITPFIVNIYHFIQIILAYYSLNR